MLERRIRHKLCWCNLKNGEGSLAIEHCTKAIELQEDVDTICDRAEAYLLLDLFSEGKIKIWELIYSVHNFSKLIYFVFSN